MDRAEFEVLVEEIKDKNDIVEVIGRRVPLKRAGSNYKGLCPFHGEKTPSFVVSPEKQIFKCFGCQKSGNVINFVSESENLSFMEALEKLAEESGIKIKRGSAVDEKKQNELYEISRQAAIYFYKNLRKGKNKGVQYVNTRGISQSTANRFGIGYAPDEWSELLDFMKSKKVPENVMLEAGIIVKKDNNKSYDKFRNRLIFPIYNTRNKVIGFGGRAIGDDSPKYLNSPETIIFKKKDNLYGLNLARKPIKEKNCAILVEGYMDVVSLSDAGVENVVASLGTALTIEQARLLHKLTDTVILAYDSDEAGQAATMRGIDILTEAGLEVKILRLTEGKDPDEFIKKNGKEAFEELVKNALPFMEYKIDCIMKQFDMNTFDGKRHFLKKICIELAKIKGKIELDIYIDQISKMAKIPESTIRSEIEDNIAAKSRNRLVEVNDKASDNESTMLKAVAINNTIKNLVKLMLVNQTYIIKIAGNDMLAGFFYEKDYEKVLMKFIDSYSENERFDREKLYEELGEEYELWLNSIVEIIRIEHGTEEKQFNDSIKKITILKLEEEQNDILMKMSVISEGGEDSEEASEELKKLSAQYAEISKYIKVPRKE